MAEVMIVCIDVILGLTYYRPKPLGIELADYLNQMETRSVSLLFRLGGN